MLIEIYDGSSGKVIGEYGFGGFKLYTVTLPLLDSFTSRKQLPVSEPGGPKPDLLVFFLGLSRFK